MSDVSPQPPREIAVGRLADGALWGSVCALLWAAPAALRVRAGVLEYLVLAGSGALVMLPLIAFARAARPWSQRSSEVFLALLLGAPVLIQFATMLKRVTHHRPLGAVTFAVVGLGVLLLGVCVTVRWVQAAASHRGAAFGLGLVITGSVLVLFSQVTAVLGRDVPAIVRHSVLDALLGGMLAGVALHLAERVRLPRSARWLGVALALVLPTVAVMALRTLPFVRDVAAGAPTVFGVGALL